eukprot:8944610-Pyramimonas_sp.AAC.1
MEECSRPRWGHLAGSKGPPRGLIAWGSCSSACIWAEWRRERRRACRRGGAGGASAPPRLTAGSCHFGTAPLRHGGRGA